MLKHRKKGLYKALSILLAAAMLLTAPIFAAQAYALEGVPRVGDTTPPDFAVGGEPKNNPQSPGLRQIYIYFSAQEASYYHAVLLENDAAPPSNAQVAAGTDAADQAAIKAFASKSMSVDMTISGFVPQHGTDYDVYIVLKDGAGNLSEPFKLDFPSPPPAALLDPAYPKEGAGQPAGSRQAEAVVKLQNIETDKKGKVYWVLLPDGAGWPSIEQVGAGTDSDGDPAISSGSPEFSPGSEARFLVTGAAGGAEYDLFMVVGDTGWAYPLSRCTNVVKLDVTTPPDIPGEKVCEIVGGTQYTTLQEAVEAAGPTATVKLLKGFTTVQGVIIDGKQITLDLNGHILTIDTTANEGLKLTDGTVTLTGIGDTGELNVRGKLCGVWANKSTVTVTNAAAADTDTSGTASGMGVYAIAGSKVTVLEDAAGAAHGVKAENIYTEVTVNGDVSNSGQIKGAVYSAGQAAVLVKGNVTSAQGYGVHSYGGSITIEKDVSGGHVGAMAEDTNANIYIKGDLSSYNNGAVIISGNGSITVDGEINGSGATPSPAIYARIASTDFAKSAGATDPANPGYFKYSTGGPEGVIWVRNPSAAVCEMDDTPYTTLEDALAAVPAEGTKTIRLLKNIDYDKGIVIDGRAVTFDVGSFTLNVTSATAGSAGLTASNGGKVSCSGTGKLNVEASRYGVKAEGGSEIHISGNVIAGQFGVYTSGSGNPKVTVDGDVTVTGQGASGEVEAVSAGGCATVTVGGHVTANRATEIQIVTAVYSNGSTVTVGRNVTTQGSGVNVQNAGTVTIDGVLDFSPTGSGAQPYIKVGPDVQGVKTADDVEDTSSKEGYWEYRNGENIVWLNTIQLGKPTGLEWDTSSAGELKAAWSAVPDANQYKVEYYKDGVKLGMETHVNPPNTSTEDIKDNLLANGAGSYTFTVKALASSGGGYADSRVSEPSAPYIGYTVTFNLNGGTRTGGGALTQIVPSSGAAAAPAVTRSGYTLTGWDKDFMSVTQNLTVTATWSYIGGGSPGGATVNASITPKAASFDLSPAASDHADIPVTLSSGSYTLSGILLNDKALVNGADYTVSGSTVTLKKSYLAALAKGEHQITFDMSGGADPVLTVTVTDKTNSGAHISFDDVTADDWFAGNVMWAYESGLMVGVSKNPMLFNPRGAMTRGMIVTILHRLENTPDTLASNPFADVAAGTWYGEAVAWAAENKIVRGYGDGRFGPEDAITREQLAVILMNYAKLKGYDVTAGADLSGFADADTVSGWATESMSWANAAGLIQGDGTKLSPARNAERCQAAAILQRFIEDIAK